MKSDSSRSAVRTYQEGRLVGWVSQRLHFLTLFFVLLTVVLFVTGVRSSASASEQIREIESKKSSVMQEITHEYEKQLEMKAAQQYYGTDIYYMQMARSRFNLICEGDHIYLFQ